MAGDRNHSTKLGVVLIGGVVALFYAAPVFFGEVFFRRDISRYVHPIFAQVRRRLAGGELPLWNPAEFGGAPLLGDVSSTTLYPPNLLLSWMSPAAAISALVVLHHLLAALGVCTLLARWGASLAPALAAGIAFSLSGYLVAMDNSMIYLVGVCWGPWVLWALDCLRAQVSASHIARLAAVFAMLFLSGELQFTYLCVLIAAAYILSCARPLRPALLGLATAGCACLALVAVQLLPLASLAMGSTRASGVAAAAAQTWALHPVRLVELFLAHPFGLLSEQSFWGQALVNNPGHTTPWSNGLYLGAALPWLALLAPRDRLTYFLWLLFVLAVLLALGPHAPLYGWLRAGLPLWSAFRYPEKLMSLATLALCLAAGRGLAMLLEAPPTAARGRRPLRLFGALAAVGAVVAIWQQVAPGLWLEWVDELLALGKTRHVDRAGALDMLAHSTLRTAALLFCAALLVLAGVREYLSPAARSGAWLTLLVLDVGTANARMVELAPHDFYETPSPVAEALATVQDPAHPLRLYRIPLRFPSVPGLTPKQLNLAHHHWLRQTLAPKSGVESGQLRYATGYSASMSARFTRFWTAMSRAGGTRALRLMAVGHVLDGMRSPQYRAGEGDRVVASFPGLDARLLALADPTAMARVVYAVHQVDSGDAALAALTAPGFDVRNSAVVQGAQDLGLSGAAPPPAQAVAISRDRPEELVMEVDTDAPGLLVVAAAYDANWRALLDGKPTPLVRTNFLLQGVALTPGRHRVVLRYQDGSLLAGAGISLFAVLALGGAVLWGRRRRQ